jgi:hypothetical protein
LAENVEFNQKLAQAFNFTLADLQANRNGLVTPAQEKRLNQTRHIRGCGQRAAFLALGGTILVFIGLIPFAAPLNLPGLQSAFPYLLFGVMLFAGIFLAAIILGIIHSRDLQTGRISVAEGEAPEFSTQDIKSKSGRVMGTAYLVTVGYTRFRLATPAQFEAFQAGCLYRVFYIKDPPVHLILSAETIDR